mgnify:CR=1 FL=1
MSCVVAILLHSVCPLVLNLPPETLAHHNLRFVFLQIVDNPIHRRSGHALHQLTLAYLLKFDHLRQHQAKIVNSLSAPADDDKRVRQAEQQQTARAEMAEVLQRALGTTAEFQYRSASHPR